MEDEFYELRKSIIDKYPADVVEEIIQKAIEIFKFERDCWADYVEEKKRLEDLYEESI